MQVNVHQAKTELSKLIERARMGDEVIIAKAGKPVVRLVSVDRPNKRVFGSARNDVVFKKGWNSPMTKRELQEFLRG